VYKTTLLIDIIGSSDEDRVVVHEKMLRICEELYSDRESFSLYNCLNNTVKALSFNDDGNTYIDLLCANDTNCYKLVDLLISVYGKNRVLIHYIRRGTG
jgi:metal-dependent HD superfamily phosphatase/phosphodiesterase